MTLPPPLDAPVFKVNKWDTAHEPAGITQLRNGESFLQGVERVSAKVGGPNVVAPVCHSLLPGMKVATDQVGVILKNGDIRLRATGAYPHTAFNPWVQRGAVIPIARVPGVEFDPLMEASRVNRRLAKKQLGQSYRQVVLQPQQVGVFEDHGSIILASQGIYVYSPNTVLRGVIDLSRMIPIMVERETEDTVAANRNIDIKINQHGRPVPDQQGHGTLVNTTKRFIPSGYKAEVAGIRVARPEKGFVALHKDASNNISMTQGICVATGSEDFVRRAKFDDNVNNRRATLDDLEIEFGDTNNYAKSTPVLELKSKDNIDALCRVQIRWRQFRPDIWVTNRGAFTDPFDMLEEKCANMMRDWLLSVPYLDALAEKSQGFTTIEHEWTAQLNDAGFTFGVAVMALRLPHSGSHPLTSKTNRWPFSWRQRTWRSNRVDRTRARSMNCQSSIKRRTCGCKKTAIVKQRPRNVSSKWSAAKIWPEPKPSPKRPRWTPRLSKRPRCSRWRKR
jgi:hypothetical protein